MRKNADVNDVQDLSEEIKKIIKQDIFFGRMNDATGSAYMKGLCGDEMEFYLVIEKGIVIQVKYYTEGCEFTRACAAAAARLADKKSIHDVLTISPQQIIKKIPTLPEDHLHCSILAVSTLYKAISDYLLKP